MKPPFFRQNVGYFSWILFYINISQSLTFHIYLLLISNIQATSSICVLFYLKKIPNFSWTKIKTKLYYIKFFKYYNSCPNFEAFKRKIIELERWGEACFSFSEKFNGALWTQKKIWKNSFLTHVLFLEQRQIKKNVSNKSCRYHSFIEFW